MYLHYCRALCFDGDPDYNNIRQLFRRLFLEKGYEYDWEFDWCKKPNKESVAQENGNKVGEDKKERWKHMTRKMAVIRRSMTASRRRSMRNPITFPRLIPINQKYHQSTIRASSRSTKENISRSSNRNEGTQSECQFR